MSSCRGQKAGEKQGDSQRPETFFKFRPRGCSWRDGLRGSETVLLAICRPIAPSFFHLLSSLSLSLSLSPVTYETSFHGGESGNPPVTRILERRKRSVVNPAGFSILRSRIRICDGTEARFIKLYLASYVSRINKGWK